MRTLSDPNAFPGFSNSSFLCVSVAENTALTLGEAEVGLPRPLRALARTEALCCPQFLLNPANRAPVAVAYRNLWQRLVSGGVGVIQIIPPWDSVGDNAEPWIKQAWATAPAGTRRPEPDADAVRPALLAGPRRACGGASWAG